MPENQFFKVSINKLFYSINIEKIENHIVIIRSMNLEIISWYYYYLNTKKATNKYNAYSYYY